MGMNVGFDLGSTYTILSVYNRNSDQLDAIELTKYGGKSIPSIVAKNGRGKYFFGQNAKSKLGNPGIRPFSAFKMLLPERGSEILCRRGYDPLPRDREQRYQADTPQEITKEFIEALLTAALQETDGEQREIDNLVIGAPEIWFSGWKTLDGRPIVRDICDKISCVRKEGVRVVSEPTAACAFFAHHYRRVTKRNYEGHILLVDYGGGTLDITLTRVNTRPDGSMEVEDEHRTGAGENQPGGQIGNAGIAYMEAVTEYAIQASGCRKGTAVPRDGDFLNAVNQLERKLLDEADSLGDTFRDEDDIRYDPEQKKIVYPDPTMPDEEVFATLNYAADGMVYQIHVTYDMLLQVYNRIICPVLSGELGKMVQFMRDTGIDYEGTGRDNFKIALVGGFGSFCLVEQQIKGMFDLFDQQAHIIQGGVNRERAVSYGAALIAEGAVFVKELAPYSIGLKGYNYAITKGEELDFDVPKFPMRNGKIVNYSLGGSGLQQFVFNSHKSRESAIYKKLSKEMIEKLRPVASSLDSVLQIGFSVDRDYVYSLHVYRFDPVLKKRVGKPETIRLDYISEMFEDVSEAKWVSGT